jgi:peptide/nickel transport system substrate-binding protein
VIAALAVAATLVSSPDTLVVGTLADPVSLDPHWATDLAAAAIVSNVCETLVRWRPDGSRPEPALATTWATPDGRRWTFTLRSGVRFHDGAPLDADAVVANLEAIAKTRGLAARAERIGPAVVGITLDQPNAALLATLSQPFFSLVSPRALAAPDHAAAAVGTGPFIFVSARPGLVELRANPDYWGGAPRLARVLFQRAPDAASLANRLIAGEVDLSTALSETELRRLRGRSDTALDLRTGLNIAFLSVNNEREGWSDRRVRQALARAIDRPALVQDALGGHGEPARNPLPPSLWGYGMRTRELMLDRIASRRLLREAGYAGGLDTTLLAVDAPRPYNPAPMRVAEHVVADLAEVGIRARMRVVATWAEFLDRATRGDYDLAVMGWQADTTDPNDFLSALLASDAVGTTNRSRYRSPVMDGLLRHGRRTANLRERASIYNEAQILFQRDMPWVPLYHVSVSTAYRRALRGLAVGPTGLSRFDKVWKIQ